MEKFIKHFVGHRGSRGVGVENTIEAFYEGIMRGYFALECDVRVSKDNQLIIFHDEDLVRLANINELVNNLTYQELKKVVLTQPIENKILTGTIPTLEEYLSLCKKHNVIPVIELKWSNGINNNDFSNINLLIDEINKYELFNQAIILTSMKDVLRHLREQYPTLNLQILLGASQPLTVEILQFVIDYNISLDLHYSLVNQEIIDFAHQHNLVVNCWCVNEYEIVEKFLKMGVDMITTDDLR